MAPKQKQSQPPGKSTNKQAKKNWAAFDFYLVFSFFKVQIIKTLAWKSHYFFNRLNYQNRYLSKTLSIEISIYQKFYLSSSNLTFKTNFSQLQPYTQSVGFPP